MKLEINLKERKPIWIALSDFYVDAELQDSDFQHISSVIRRSPYSFAEIKQIDKEEVFPVLYSNLIVVAGIWTGFKQEWLVEEIIKKIQKRTSFSRAVNKLKYLCLKWMYKDYWERLEAHIEKADHT